MKGVITAIGIAIVAGHAAAYVHFADRAKGGELVLETSSPLASPTLNLDGKIPESMASRVKRDVSEGGLGAGLRHIRWTAAYRGGFERSVGATQLVGPFQDPAAHACSGRVIVGQQMLGAIAPTMKSLIESEMKGTQIFALGDFEKVAPIELVWAQLAKHPEDTKMMPKGTDGYVRVSTRIVFEHVEIPLTVSLVPAIVKGELKFSIQTRAELDFDNRVLQWASDKLGGNSLATKLAARELDGQLITTLAPPPPFDLPDHQRLEFTYCNEAPEIIDRQYAALPFAVTLGRVDGAPNVLPIALGRAPHAPVTPGTLVALDLDLDGLNGLLYELWRSGFLDRRLAEVGLDKSFNTDPIVTEYLSLRISPVRLALPPVLTADAKGLQLAADGRVSIADGSATTVGRLWGGLGMAMTGAGKTIATSVDLRTLELTCERGPTTLVPCYSDLVGAVKDRGGEFHGVLTDAFAKLLTDIFVEQRVAATGMPMDLVIRGVTPSLTLAPPNASMRLTFDASLAPTK